MINTSIIHPQTIDPIVREHITNILIVDDRPENLTSLSSILEQENRNIIKAYSGNDA
jgi:response regulator RpfG family c-di-GMP phosphodiesterase